MDPPSSFKHYLERLDRICAPFSRWTIKPTDSPEDVFIKKLYVPLAIFFLCVSSSQAVEAFLGDRLLQAIGLISNGGVCLFVLCRAVMGRDMGRTVDASLVMFVLATAIYDLAAAAELVQRGWSNVVLILDASLVYNRPQSVPIVFAVLSVYLLLERMEFAFRFGLYDFGVPSPSICECVDPPCAGTVSHALFTWGNILSVLAVDFILTRGFSIALHRQMRRIKASVDVSAGIAAALARYDVDGAEEAIAKAGDLPEELAESYTHLLSNLRSYRAYLPDGLLHSDEWGDDGKWAAAAPGVGVEDEAMAAMVFTDIQSSTALWEACPQAMH
eukprot:Hpha_TRINITY_DN15525_c2_g1::TRINITY_DN15525_c2_g1_i1::g.107370::m.107370